VNHAPRPVLITDARPSPERQVRSREIRYLAMMGVRVLCLVVAGVLVSSRVPLLWLWVPLCLVGMVVLPWLAVLLANDAPPKSVRHRAGPGGGDERPTTAAIPPPAAPDRTIIDLEP